MGWWICWWSLIQAFLAAWSDACNYAGLSKLVVPKGVFCIGPVSFVGPCYNHQSPKVVIQGILKAPAKLSAFPDSYWIMFYNLNGLTLTGEGTASSLIDAQGEESWQNPGNGTYPIVKTFSLPSLVSITVFLDHGKKIKSTNWLCCHFISVAQIGEYHKWGDQPFHTERCKGIQHGHPKHWPTGCPWHQHISSRGQPQHRRHSLRVLLQHRHSVFHNRSRRWLRLHRTWQHQLNHFRHQMWARPWDQVPPFLPPPPLPEK